METISTKDHKCTSMGMGVVVNNRYLLHSLSKCCRQWTNIKSLDMTLGVLHQEVEVHNNYTQDLVVFQA